VIKKTKEELRFSLLANADAIFIRTTTKLGHEVDLPISHIIDPEEKERQINIIIDKQLAYQEKKIIQ